MLIEGQKISARATMDVVLPRPDGDHVVLKVAAVLDSTDFERMVPDPSPPILHRKGRPGRPDFGDQRYLDAKHRHDELSVFWLMAQSLKATPGLTWQTVDDADPETWENVQKELVAAGFGVGDRKRILNAVMKVNALSSEDVEEVAQDFFTEDR